MNLDDEEVLTMIDALMTEMENDPHDRDAVQRLLIRLRRTASRRGLRVRS